MESKKNDTSKLISETETDSRTSKTNLRLPKGKHGWGGRDKLGVWDEYIHTTIYKIDNQQGPTVYQRERYSIFYNNLYGKRI